MVKLSDAGFIYCAELFPMYFHAYVKIVAATV